MPVFSPTQPKGRSAMKYIEVNDRQYSTLIGAAIGFVLGIIIDIIVIYGPLRGGSLHILLLPGNWITDVFVGLDISPSGEQSFPLRIMSGIIFWPIFMTIIGSISGYVIHRK